VSAPASAVVLSFVSSMVANLRNSIMRLLAVARHDEIVMGYLSE
jgi:hypothetical protein